MSILGIDTLGQTFGRRATGPQRFATAGFDEAKHPRGGAGQFAQKSEVERRVAQPEAFEDTGLAKSMGMTHRFQTSKGSLYLMHKTGGTSRFKRSPGKGQGTVEPHSSATHFITPERSEKLRELMQDYANHPTYKAAIRRVDDGKLGFVVKHRQTGQVHNGLSRLITVDSFEPKVGLSPIDVWDKDAAGEYGFHLGHPVTRVERL